MHPVILFRKNNDNQDEYYSCRNNLATYQQRTEIPENSLVIGRFSVLPYYYELETDLYLNGKSKLINSFKEHEYIASFDYYHDIEQFTPKTYFELKDIPNEGQFVVKGKTNSRKFDWNTKMFAKDRTRAIEIASELQTDGLIGSQGIIVRDYVPLKTLEIGINGLPFTNEWRFFFLFDQIIAYDFYWTIIDRDPKELSSGAEPIILAEKVAKIISQKTNFFVIDVAQTQAGDWIVIEVNDGQMSGLSCINSQLFYFNLRNTLNYFKKYDERKKL